MTIDLNNLKAITIEPDSHPKTMNLKDEEKVLVIIKLAEGASLPEGIEPRMVIANLFYTAEVTGKVYKELQADKRVASMEVTKNLNLLAK